ncbi:Transcriptional regulator, AsnC family [Syntrophobacter sp. SbD1]|nr:Transcriptional regulator, AsnC family [Syntrophobacter sp. SbD1]
MDSTSRVLLDRIQRSFPIVSEPYRVLSETLGISEEEVLERIAILKQSRVIRQISAIFNTGALGYRSSLVAMAVPQESLERSAQIINAYPGVSHNYLRPGKFNMWFTIAAPPGQSVESVVAELSAKACGLPALVLPAIKKYKLAVVLDVLEDGDWDQAEEKLDLPPTESDQSFRPTPANIAIVKSIQEDLPLVPNPFGVWADSLGMEEHELLRTVSDWMLHGTIRRFAAVLNHREVGFRANGMVIWNCPLDRIDEAGAIMASYPEVSHCYNRPACADWPYNLYAMIHGRSPEECGSVAQRLTEAAGLADFQILFSSREYKKIRLKLFWQGN